MRHELRALYWTVALAVLAAPAGAGERFRVEPVGARDGLVGTASTVFVDRTGFLWTATGNGLIRFDGYSAKVFARDPSDPTSLPDNIVHKIYEDRHGRFWLGTYSGGLSLLDRATGTFTRYQHDPADPRSISPGSVMAVLEDQDGTLWVGTQNGLNRFDPGAGTFERLMADPDDPGRPGNDAINAIHEDTRGALWIATSGGLNRRDPQTGEFSRFTHDPEDPHSIDMDVVFSIAEDRDGALWVGTATGLNRLDPDAGTFRRYTAEFQEIGGPIMISALAAGPSGTVWIGTFGRGLYALDTATGEIRAGRDPEEDLSGVRILALHTTPDAVYASTWGSGVKRVRFAAVPVTTLLPDPDPRGVKDVTAIVEDRDGTLWLGTYGGGLRRRDPVDPEFRAVDAPGPRLFAVAQGIDDVWYGGEEGLGRVDRRTGESSFFAHDPEDPRGLGAGFVAALLEDSDGRLWVGTSKTGLQRLRADGRSFETFAHDPADSSSLSDNYITVLHEDVAGTLWVGTAGGLHACDRATARCVRYEPDPEDPRSLDAADISAILEDRKGRLWVGTAGGGVHLLDGDGFRHFGESGLPTDGVRGLVEDDDGSLWISTRHGLIRYDRERDRAMSLGLADGLPTVDFHHGGSARGKDRLFFGTARGAIAIPAGTPFREPRSSPTVFTSIQSLEGPVAADRPVSAIELVRLPYGEVLTFEFAVLDFDPANRHRYAYRMTGVADDWVDLGGHRDVTFTDLRPGSHTLWIKGRNALGVWSERSVDVQIVPPFWMTWWFRLGVLAGVVLGAFSVYRIRVSALERRNRELERLHRELRSLTLRMEAAKEDERRRISRELHDEMGQVLSATKISLQMLPGLPDAAARYRKVEDVVALVDQMIKHVRALSLDLSPPFLDEVGLGLALQGYLDTVSKHSGVEIRVDAEPDINPPDRETSLHIFRLVQESITNIIRHSGAHAADVRMQRRDDHLEISIRDDGRGFDVEEVLRRSVRGQHLGLLGMRERAGALGADLTIDSRPGGGTEVRIRLPLS